MKLLQEIGVELQLGVQTLLRKAQDFPWQTSKRRLVVSTLGIVSSVVNTLSIMTGKFGQILNVATAEYSQKGERSTKKKLTKRLHSERNLRMEMNPDDRLIRLTKDELALVFEWGSQFVLMGKKGFIVMEQLKIQKSQQLIDSFSDPKTSDEMKAIAKIYHEQLKTQKEVNQNIIHKDHPELTIEDQIGEAYGGD